MIAWAQCAVRLMARGVRKAARRRGPGCEDREPWRLALSVAQAAAPRLIVLGSSRVEPRLVAFTEQRRRYRALRAWDNFGGR
jgi:hypothetical protein